ncbi:usg protein [Phaeobacter sp. B1627]|uniref:usg protein n=1 Tax=Phaeobacter sp. B1627 TaxID=2583809 RepID=UPI00111AF6AC|nr:aspartate-semialdehyde dehydrogenase [Phaeobacter sp. B1627]TNJ41568.1 aspartate-semialdehyde dehydrogenase [Phaeobacter sp. B1627]
MDSSEAELMLRGYGLTTAEFIYHMPDFAHVLNVFVWQEYDLAPDHPRLLSFIDFWKEEIEGPLRQVRFSHRKRVSSGEWCNLTGEFYIN